MSDALWLALALLLVLEGLMPAINPGGWRRMFEQILGLQDHQIRVVGLVSMVAGLLLLWVLQSA
ncbi:DUF2065 domain-containing protein [Aquabacterium sp.]|jgi:uncharacterized protein YjeT (DUF2065 family)|uniref:DUF2065 domain-containing protein n=1 Tax=Aquabacterium TaxID=92793 RepID=UPI001DCA7C9E|nr:DUF2065 domain-containing protein [Aquabacterium sp.]MBT9610337.1 DUF2065 domain-containing protein [Aquabacterium sp.]|tara:strand:+ start:661 stop:852 length:192 start_codon:yes stop_codon:yes gene_type:complete